ncbi:uncharacterized protein PAN0_002d1218 [Moesziomyces antarcticus]|uniref:uncharacterized protein n=1 Tax=Pseudozyma antarctica TaxID=84753 RepID=UPI000719547B|nr:uncharacterized protein PAN0_002d1218 [Moesziomyces antarcticus]GAK63016.1 hypothetical protein PAN0_002d1218 [Moesziomyces antarcticus]
MTASTVSFPAAPANATTLSTIYIWLDKRPQHLGVRNTRRSDAPRRNPPWSACNIDDAHKVLLQRLCGASFGPRPIVGPTDPDDLYIDLLSSSPIPDSAAGLSSQQRSTTQSIASSTSCRGRVALPEAQRGRAKGLCDQGVQVRGNGCWAEIQGSYVDLQSGGAKGSGI